MLPQALVHSGMGRPEVPTFLGDTDLKGLSPAAATYSSALFGAALSRNDLLVAWVSTLRACRTHGTAALPSATPQ